MSERITSITMQAFRGVPETFTVDLSGGRSCVVLGDNGTGKSTIADAVEWYFEGRIEFLTKEGRGAGIRHSGAREELETQVAISTDGSLGGKITPSVPSPQTVRDIGRSELFLLRGRTLADFVDKTKPESTDRSLEGAGCRAAGEFGGRAGVRRAVPERGAVAQRGGGAERAGARVREA